MGFEQASSTTGQALTDLSVGKFKNLDLKNKLKAGGVDGALALLSEENGFAGCIHCCGHRIWIWIGYV